LGRRRKGRVGMNWIIGFLIVSVLFFVFFWAACHLGARKDAETHEPFIKMKQEENNTITSGSAVTRE